MNEPDLPPPPDQPGGALQPLVPPEVSKPVPTPPEAVMRDDPLAWQQEREEARERIRLLEEKVKALEAIVATLSPEATIPLSTDGPLEPLPSDAGANAGQPAPEEPAFEPAARLVGEVETLDAVGPGSDRRVGSGSGDALVISDVSYFFEPLSAHGIWQQVPGYGFVWSPRGIGSTWRPYVDGRWCSTDRGWMWMSNEPFGWATYHYGRWCQMRDIGWVWVPGCEWGPAWVSWRAGSDYCGWAPLPPETMRATNLDGWVDNYYDIGPGLYVFVNHSRLGQTTYQGCIDDVALNHRRIRESMNLTKIMEHAPRQGRRHLGGLDPRLLSNVPGGIPRYQVDFENTAQTQGHEAYRIVNGSLKIPKPAPQPKIVAKPAVYRTFGKVEPNRGWDEVQNPDELRGEMRNSAARFATGKIGSTPSSPAIIVPKTGAANPVTSANMDRVAPGNRSGLSPVAKPSAVTPVVPQNPGLTRQVTPRTGLSVPTPVPTPSGPPTMSPAMEQVLRNRKN